MKVQHDNDGECCNLSARNQLKDHLNSLCTLAMETKPGPFATGQGNLATMREIVDILLSPHGRVGEGLTPESWIEPPADAAMCSCAEGGSEAPRDQSFLTAVDDSVIVQDSVLDDTLAEGINNEDFDDDLLDKDDEPEHKLDPK